MRDKQRIPEILSLIYEIWNKEKNQDLRLCQLLYNIIFDYLWKRKKIPLGETASGNQIFYFEDDILIEILKEKLRRLNNDL